MDQLRELVSTVLINDFEKGTEHWVDVTHINDPHDFYVRPTAYRKYMATLEEPGSPMDPNQIEQGKLIIFKSLKLNKYVRGQIFFVDNNEGIIKCDVFTPDVGLFEKSVSLEKIHERLNDVDIPALITHCQLADCKPIGNTFTKDAIDSMKLYVGKERAKMVIRGKLSGKLVVELINSCPDDIATMLAYIGETTLGYDNNVVSRFKPTFEPRA